MDLYYRLKGMSIHVPALRERQEDIPLIVHHTLKQISQEEGHGKRISPAALAVLKSYTYPGNVRELIRAVQQAFYCTQGDTIEAQALPPEICGSGGFEASAFEPGGRAIYQAIRSGRANFETGLKRPFLKREISSGILRTALSLALADAIGRYKEAFSLLGILPREYAATMVFLKRHKCYLDFRPYRDSNRGET